MEAIIIRKQATCIPLRTGLPSWAFNPIFIRIKLLPQIKARMAMVRMEERESFFTYDF